MTKDEFNAARKAVYRDWTCETPEECRLSEFVWLTMERHNVHPAPWTMALLLNWEVALRVFTAALAAGKPEECMRLSRWLGDASLGLQDSFARAGTPAPSGPAEVYRQLLAGGYEPPTVIGHTDEDMRRREEAESCTSPS